MKKSLIALAIAGAMTAPIVAQADATLYGNVEVEAVFGDNFSNGESADADLQLDDAIIGVKGSSALENLDGVESFYQLEVEFATNGGVNDEKAFGSSTEKGEVSTRKALVGLSGSFGTVIFGRQNILAEATERADMYAESYSTNNYFAFNDRVGNAASYVTPKMAGFEAYAQIVVEGTGDNEDDDVDGGFVGFNYELGGFALNVGYGEVDTYNGFEDDRHEILGVGLGYAIGDLALDATYQTTEDGDNGDETDMYALAAAYNIGNATVGATFMDYEEDYAGGEESDEWGVFASYKLGKKAKLKAQYSSADVDGDSGDYDKFVLGYNVSF